MLYFSFCSCLCDYTVGYFAIREVFNMESSVRLQAIQNIGRRLFLARHCQHSYVWCYILVVIMALIQEHDMDQGG